MRNKLILFLMLALFGSTSFLRATEVNIDFETGDLSQFAFVNDETYPWVITSDDAFSGTYCIMSSNAGIASSSSTIEATMVFPSAGTVSFDALCMGEGTSSIWDKCIFKIDDVQQFQYGANVSGWNNYSYEVAAGEHTFTWTYSKDSSVNPEGDFFKVDNIIFTFEAGEVSVTPTEFALGERPRNGWMEPFAATIYNKATETPMQASISNTSGSNPFRLSQTINTTLPGNDSICFNVLVNSSAPAGTYSETFTLTYTADEKDVIEIPVTGTLYTAGTADIVEKVKTLTLGESNTTHNPTSLHANYLLHGMTEMLPDAVYSFTLESDRLVVVNITASNGLIALYNVATDETFHPNAEMLPYAMANGNTMTQALVAGHYYMIVAGNNLTQVQAHTEELPAPSELTYIAPEDYAMNVAAPVTLTWTGGEGATLYKVLFSSSYPLQDNVDWMPMNDNFGNFPIADLEYNTHYFWQVKAMNSKGTVEGPVWGFTTVLQAPTNVEVTEDEIFTNDSTMVKWQGASAGGGFVGEITVADGTEYNSYIPVYGLWMDDYTRSEMIYPAEMLAEMQGGEINSITYYTQSAATAPWTPASFNVYVKEVEETTLTNYLTFEDATLVYSGGLDGTGATMTVTFDTPYQYNGGNLWVGYEQIVEGTYKSCAFWGIESTGSSASGYSSASATAATFNQRNFLPKTTFVCGGKGIANRTFQGYNVYYKNGDADPVKINTELILDKKYMIGNLPYNVDPGHDIHVTAVYHEGESAFDNGNVKLHVSGYGKFTGTVTELISGDPIEGVIVKFNGKDEFNNSVSFTDTTDATGTYLINEVKCGTYTGMASLEGFATAYSESVTLAYDATETVDFVMHEDYKPVLSVYAEELDPTMAKVSWSMNTTISGGGSGGGGGSGSGSSSFSEGFENGMPEGWTVLDANNDGTTWCLTSDIPSTWTYYASLTLDWYRTGTNAICSGSYINGIGAITPNEYLITSQVTPAAGSTFSFWAAATDASYPADHFGVAVSTTGTSASDFTILSEWTLTAKGNGIPGGVSSREGKGEKLGTWHQYSVDLSSYAGQPIYIAIRHFNCNDQYIMCVDDIEFGNGSKDRSVQYYTLYRKAIMKETEVTPEDSVMLVNNYTDTLYADFGWSNLEAGTYQYGVSAVYPTPGGKGRANRAETVIDFETNDFSQGNFDNTSAYPWVIVDANGSKVMKSNNGGQASTNSTITLTFEMPTDGTISFDAECMGEGTSTAWDKCIFTLDGNIKFTYGAHVTGWNNYSYEVEAGTHTMIWSYQKDGSVNPTGDYFAVDNITFTYEGPGGESDDPVTAITWSNILPKNMEAALTVNAVATTGSAEGATVTLTNLNENFNYNAEIDSTGAVVFEDFRKGEYKMTVALEGFESEYNETEISIWSDTTLTAHFTEVLAPVSNLVVSGTGFARWTDMLPAATEVAERYLVTMNNVLQGETTNNFMQFDVDGLTVGQTYEARVAVIYTTGMSPWTSTTFTYIGCEAVATQVDTLWSEVDADAMAVTLYWNQGSGPNPPTPPTPPTGDVYSFEGSLEGWTTIDADGDGNNWNNGSVLMAGYLIPSHDGEDCVTSASYYNNVPLTPDNYLVSPSKAEYSAISFWACAQDPDYAAEHFGVAVSTTGNTSGADFTTVAEWTMTAKDGGKAGNYMTRSRESKEGTWYQYSVDLSDYAGQNIWVAIRHFGCTDMFYINVDEVSFNGGSTPPTPPTPPTGDVYSFEGSLEGWTTIDADGDGNNWNNGSILMAGYSIPSHDGSDCVTSASYYNNVPLTPDNYLVSPAKAEYTAISFWACAQDPSYPAEHFGVAVSTTGNTSGADFTTVAEWTMTAKDGGKVGNYMTRSRESKEGTWYQYTVDLGDYVGQEIWVAIRHFGCTDMFYINVDEVTLATPESKLGGELSNAGVGFGNINYNFTDDGNWYYYDNGVNSDAIGLTSGGGFYWGILLPAGNYEGNRLTKVAYFDYAAHSGQVMIYQGGTAAPTTLLYTQNYNVSGTGTYIEIEMTEPVEIDDSQSVWVVMHNTNGQYVAAIDAGPGVANGSCISTDGSTWYNTVSAASGGSLDGNWNLRAYIETGGGGAAGASTYVPGKFNILVDGEVVGATSDNTFTVTATDYDEHLYEVVYVDANYNISCPMGLLIRVPLTSVGSNELVSSIYPNPTSGDLHIQASDMVRVSVLNTLGQILFDQAVKGDEITLDMARYEAGVYLINVTTKNGSAVKRVVVTK